MSPEPPELRPTMTPEAYGTKLSATLSAMFSEAITVAQLVKISDEVFDSAIVFATPSAACLFGLRIPQDLIGRYFSQIHHPEDALVTRHYTLARFHDEWVPDSYPMRILRGPQREPVPVIKHVRQVTINGVLTWITVHTPFDFTEPFVMPVTQSMLDRAGTAEEQELLGRMHVAHMDQQLRHGNAEPIPNLDRLLQCSPNNLMVNPKMTSMFEAVAMELSTTKLVETVIKMYVHSEDERPHYVCLRCAWPWYGMPGNSKRPRKCPRCQDKNWDRPRLRMVK